MSALDRENHRMPQAVCLVDEMRGPYVCRLPASVIKSVTMKSKLLLSIGGLLFVASILVAASPEKKPNPAEAARLNSLGCAYMNQQLFEKALKSFQDSAALDPNLSIAKLNEGIALSSLGRVDAAKKVLDEAAKADPKNPRVWYGLGLLDKNSSDPQAAIEDFKRVIAIDDSDADTWYFLGTVYSQIKEFPKAIDAFERALKLNPRHASAQFGLSRAYQQSGQSALAREHLTRFQYITQHKLGSAMSLAYGEQGKYSLCQESPAVVQKVPPQIPVKFVDVTRSAGLNMQPWPSGYPSSGLGPGACWLDYDGDGHPDLFLPDSGRGMALYHNLGNGKFEDVTKNSGLDPNQHAVSCTAGDYDNDGAVDLAVGFTNHLVLLHNEKNGTFKDVTAAAGIRADFLSGDILVGPVEPGLTFVDYDHDGDLDLYVTVDASSVPMTARAPTQQLKVPATRMWRNNGNGTFTDVTESTGLAGDVAATSSMA